MRECIGHAPAFVATRVGEVLCPEEAGWSSPGACGGASCEYVEVDLRPNPRPAGQAASRASRPRIAASPPPKAILSPLSPTTPSARAEKWGGPEGGTGTPPPNASAPGSQLDSEAGPGAPGQADNEAAAPPCVLG